MISLSLLEFARCGTSKNCRRLLEYRVLGVRLVASNENKNLPFTYSKQYVRPR